MTPTDKPCLPGCREDSHLRYGEGGVEYLSGPIRVVTGMIHAPNCPNAPNAPKEPAAPRCVLDCRFTPLGLNPAVYHAPGCSEADAWCEECKKAKDACICPKRPAPPPEPTTPEAKSADFEWDWAEGRARAYTLETAADRGDRNLGRAYLALRAELAAKDEKLRGLDYLYGELGNQNSFLRAELAEAKAEINRYNAALRDLVGDAALLKDQLAAERLLVRMQSAEAWTTGPSREASEAATAILAARAAKGGAK